MRKQIEEILKTSNDRSEFWLQYICDNRFKTVAELGVFKGKFAEKMLKGCESIEQYIMIDPWRNLSDWNKPANTSDSKFESYYRETIERTELGKDKRIVLRGKTTEVIDQIEDDSLDFIYIDGDHTLKGISIDLIITWNKVKSNGIIGGDDFSETIWQHEERFEPTLVFPFAVYFAEAMNTKIYGLPFQQFLITKEMNGFEFIDLTKGKYRNKSLVKQSVFRKKMNSLKFKFKNLFHSKKAR